MKKDDYKINLEEERKEIDLPDEENVQSRVALHSKNNHKKGARFSLVNVLLVIFTLIPITILIFVYVSLNMSKEPIIPQAESDEIQFEKIGDSNKGEDDIIDPEKEAALIAEEKKQEEARKQAEQEEREKEEARKQEEAEAAEVARKQAEAEAEAARKQEEARKQEKARQEELARQQAEAEKKKAEANKNQNQPSGGGRTHTVAPGETLYRISVNYYQTGDGVDKIRGANGLSSNEISVGQKLVIP